MEKEKISVVVAVYNKENYLRKCFDSIINQKYKNLEIILVNDGSTDNSKEICEEYEKKDNRIKFIDSINQGASSARNLGLKNVTGDYISFIDADDFISENFYTYLYNYMIKCNADIVECNSVKVNAEIENTENIYYIPEKEEVVETNNIGALLRLYGDEEEFYGKTIVVWNKLYKRKIFDNILFEPGRIIDDECFTYKALYNCERFVTLNAGLYAYVYAENSTMRSKVSIRKAEEIFLAYKEVAEFFEKNKFIDLQERALRRYLEYIIDYKKRIIDSDLPNKEEIFNEFTKKFNMIYGQAQEIIGRIPVLQYRTKMYEKLLNEYKNLL